MSAELEHYRKLGGALSDMIEGGRLWPGTPVSAADRLELIELLTTVPQAEPANRWTVLVERLFADSNYLAWVTAETAEQAAAAAIRDAISDDGPYGDDGEHEPSDYRALLVVSGHHEGVFP